MDKKSAHLWKSISVGGKSTNELIQDLRNKNFGLSDEAMVMTIHKKFITSRRVKEVKFAKKTAQEIGFTGDRYIELLRFLQKQKTFKLCEPEDSFYLRFAYSDQPQNELAYVAMNVISIEGDYAMLGHNAFALRGISPDFKTNPDFKAKSCKMFLEEAFKFDGSLVLPESIFFFRLF